MSFHRSFRRQRRRHSLHWIPLWLTAVLVPWYRQSATIVTCFGPTTFVHQNRPQQQRQQPLPLKSLSSTSLRDASEQGTPETTIPLVLPPRNVTVPPKLHDASAALKLKSPTKMPPVSAVSSSSSSSSQRSKPSFISTPELDWLHESIDIVSLIELYDLPHFHRTSGSGERATCLCPFHDDTNPSLKIDGRRGIFKCFSCGTAGNAVKFVQEYSKLHGNRTLSFVEAVRLLQDLVSPPSSSTESDPRPRLPFGIKVPMGSRPPVSLSARILKGRQNAAAPANSGATPGTGDRDAPSPEEGPSQTAHRKQRILLANLHAASFYGECLLSLPTAGSARAHLRSRGINPQTVKAFAVGFAPDAYFATQQQQPRPEAAGGETTTTAWGEGSLVNRLRDLGFTPREILDAGLAIRTRWGKRPVGGTSDGMRDDDDGDLHNENDYSTLMDRFRGRLVVPIFDAAGGNVLGFGGRILEASVSTGSTFKAAKYLNSPNSLVFHKKDLLFGQHMAEQAARSGPTAVVKKTDEATGEAARSSLLVVEGYMDAISMWQAGIRETVACMGTALSYEQLAAASKAARKLGARIVLCLDSDDAGVAAIERLCTGQKPILVSAMESLNVDIYVASLPEGIKDPADFLERHRDVEGLEEKFRVDVVQNALEWSEWYMIRVIGSYDPDPASEGTQTFSAVFERLASFLSTFENTEELSKRASLVVPKLANFIRTEGTNETSYTVRIQLESDLVEKAMDIARSKSIQFQRSGEIERFPKNLEISNAISLMEGPWESITKNSSDRRASEVREIVGIDESAQTAERFSKRSARKQRSLLTRQSTINPTRKPMTKYVGGFNSNVMDANWLGVRKGMYEKESNHLRYELSVQPSASDRKTRRIGPDVSVRFNTNDYHGTWTTKDATLAGYKSNVFPKNSDFLEKGTSSLISVNEGDMSAFVEDVLLRTMVQFPGARKSLGESIRASEATGSGGIVDWSSPEKAWLFKCLVESKELEDVIELRSFLLGRPDLIPGALSRVSTDTTDCTEAVEAEIGQIKLPTDVDNLDTVSVTSFTRMEGVAKGAISLIGEDWLDDQEAKIEPIPARRTTMPTSSRVAIPALVGEEWSDFPELEDYIPSLYAEEDGTVVPLSDVKYDDAQMDATMFAVEDEMHFSEVIPITPESTFSVAPPNLPTVIDPERVDGTSRTSTNGFLEADFVASGVPASEEEELKKIGILDRFLVTMDVEELDIFTNSYGDHDLPETGNNENKANWAVQDLYTMLQFTSVLQRIGAGRMHMLFESSEMPLRGSEDQQLLMRAAAVERNDESPVSATTIANVTRSELVEYCSGDGLRDDLHRVRNLFQANQRARERIYSLLHAQFSDANMFTRGYSWLGKVLQFNQRKMESWTAIVEQEEGFFYSEEGLEEFEQAVEDEWNELSDEGEMWEWNKNVDVLHESYIAANLRVREAEASGKVLEQIENEWGWAIGGEDDADEEGEEEWADNEVEYDYEDKWGTTEGDVEFDDETDWVMRGENDGESWE